MQKGFQDTSSQSQFKGFPNLNMQQSNSAYGYSGCTFWLDAAFGLNTQTNLGAVSRWQPRVGNGVFEQGTVTSQFRLIQNLPAFNNYPAIDYISNGRFMFNSLPNGVPNAFTIAFVGQRYLTLNQAAIVACSNLGNFSNLLNSSNISFGGTFNVNQTGIGIYSHLATRQLGSSIEDTMPHICVISNTFCMVDEIIYDTGNISYNTSIRVLGAQDTSNAFGYLGELLIFNYTMKSDEAIDLSNRINTKYAIY